MFIKKDFDEEYTIRIYEWNFGVKICNADNKKRENKKTTEEIFIIRGFRTIVFIFIIIFTTFRPICPQACRNRNLSRNFEPRTLFYLRGSPALIQTTNRRNTIKKSGKYPNTRRKRKLQIPGNIGSGHVQTEMNEKVFLKEEEEEEEEEEEDFSKPNSAREILQKE